MLKRNKTTLYIKFNNPYKINTYIFLDKEKD